MWFFLILGIALFIFSLRKQPIKDWLFAFFTTSFFATVLGTVVIDLKLIEYLKLGDTFNSGQIYELILFPVISVYFYQTSYRSNLLSIIIQCALYASGLTIPEVILEKYTDLIKFVDWHWTYTLLSVFCFMLAIRFLLKLINRKNKQ